MGGAACSDENRTLPARAARGAFEEVGEIHAGAFAAVTAQDPAQDGRGFWLSRAANAYPWNHKKFTTRSSMFKAIPGHIHETRCLTADEETLDYFDGLIKLVGKILVAGTIRGTSDDCPAGSATGLGVQLPCFDHPLLPPSPLACR